MKFSEYMIKEAFDKVGKQLTQIHQKVQKAQSCDDMKKVVDSAGKLLNSIDKGIAANVELFFRDYKSLIKKIGIDTTLNTISMIQEINMNIQPLSGTADKNQRIKEELRKIEKEIRDRDFELKQNMNKQQSSVYKIEKLEWFFRNISNQIDKIIRIKKKVMK